MEDPMIWKQRWHALDEMMDALQIRVDAANLSASNRRPPILRTLLAGLRAFAKAQFAFFYDGFGAQKFIQLQPGKLKYSTDYALRVTINQIADDIDLIQRLTEQCITAEVMGKAQSKLSKTLNQADRLAYDALQPMLNPQEPSLTVLTYFQKAVNVRIIPYAPVVLIGIPLTCLETAHDFLAIPHEVGHYLYWNHVVAKTKEAQPQIIKQFLKEELSTKFGKRELWRAWEEEIFADIYGCLVGGPVMALSNQALQSQQPMDMFFPKQRADGAYPFPVVRPYIYTQVLKKIGMAAIAAQLDDHWHQSLDKTWGIQVNSRDALAAHPRLAAFDMSRFLAFVDAMTDHVLQAILPITNVDQQSNRWFTPLGADEPVTRLYDQFAQAMPTRSVPDHKLASDYPQVWQNFLVDRRYEAALRIKEAKATNQFPNNWPDLALDEASEAAMAPVVIPGRPWKAVVELDGWTTEGPVGKPHSS